MHRFLIGICLVLPLSVFSQKNSGIPEIDSLPIQDWKVVDEPLSYLKTVGLSLLIPGGGQVYSGHYVRAGFIFAIEGLLLQDSFIGKHRIFKLKNEQIEEHINDHYNSLAATGVTEEDSLEGSPRASLIEARQEMDVKMFHLDLRKSQIAWALGMHFYNVMDAVEIVANSRRTTPKDMNGTSAFWYGLMFPGGGQLYTGHYGKFGMLWMAIGSSIASAVYRQQMVDYFQNRIDLVKQEESSEDITELREDATLYRKRRNQYFWGMAVLYMYAIGDGMVDAILSDFNAKERYAVVPGNSPMSLALQLRF